MTSPEPQAVERVLVLGASGFVGRHLVRTLGARRMDVVPFSSGDLDLRSAGSVGTLRAALRPSDTLVVCAALTPDRGRDVATFMANLAMAEHVLAALAGGPCRQVVYLSSDAVYADGEDPLNERSRAEPATLHGLMHLAREGMIRMTLERSATPLFILRPCALYGPGDTHNSYGPNRFVRSAQRGEAITLFGEGEDLRDHVYVDDLCRLIALGIERASAGVLNVATGRSISFRDLAHIVRELAGAGVEVRTTGRMAPLSHRRMDIAALRAAFPEVELTPPRAGIARMLGDQTPP